MRAGVIIVGLLVLVGCAGKPPGLTAAQEFGAPARYEETTASALMFDPPVAAMEEGIDLSREDRMPSAFVGFDGPVTTYFWIHTDDLQRSTWGRDSCGDTRDLYCRRAIMDKIGVSYR